MNTFKFLISRVERREKQVAQEWALLTEQAKYVYQIADIDRAQADVLVRAGKIYKYLHEMYRAYLEQYSKMHFEPFHLTTAVSCHLELMKYLYDEFVARLEVIRGIQKENLVILDLDAEKEKKKLSSDDSSVDDVLSTLSFLFPYHHIFELAMDGSFLKSLLKRILMYEPRKGKESKPSQETISKYEDLVRSVSSMKALDRKYNQITRTILAEFIVSFFLGEPVRGVCMDHVEDFEIAERCRLLVKLNLKPLYLSETLVDRLTHKEIRTEKTSLPSFPEDLQQKVELDCEFEWGGEPVIPMLHHVILQLRRVTTQVSVSFMHFLLMDTIRLLNLTLATKDEKIGADENFQFFVAVLCEAKLCFLPSLIKLLENFTLSSIRTSKTQFIVTHLGICCDFIKMRQLPIPPEILLPYTDEHIPGLKRSEDPPIPLRGFVMYAVPTFVRSDYPLTVWNSGALNKQTLVYKYEATDERRSDSEVVFLPSATMNGNLMHVTKEEIAKHKLIRIDSPEYASAPNFSDSIADFTRMLVLCNTEVQYPRIDQLTDLSACFARQWSPLIKCEKKQAHDIISEMQTELKKKGILKEAYRNGILDYPTKCAIEAAVPSLKKEGRFYVDKRVWKYICHD